MMKMPATGGFSGVEGALDNTARRSSMPGKTPGVSSNEGRSVNVQVCVGTGCYLRGAYDVLNKFTEMARQLNLEDYVQLQGNFCLEHCEEGVSIKVGEEIITGVNLDNAEEIFKKRIALKADPPWA